MRDHASSEIVTGSNYGIDATKKLPGEGDKRPWPSFSKLDAAPRKRVNALFGNQPQLRK